MTRDMYFYFSTYIHLNYLSIRGYHHELTAIISNIPKICLVYVLFFVLFCFVLFFFGFFFVGLLLFFTLPPRILNALITYNVVRNVNIS